MLNILFNQFPAFPLGYLLSKKIRWNSTSFLIVGWTIFFALVPLNVFAQEKPVPLQSNALVASEIKIIKKQLFQITQRKLKIKDEVELLKNGPQTKEATDRIEDLRSERKELSRNFESIAAHINEEDLVIKEESGMNWLDELQELTMPLLQAVHEVSEKPRKIDKLKARIENLKTQITKYEIANSKLNALTTFDEQNNTVDPKILQSYQKQLARLQDKYSPEFLKFKLGEAERNLAAFQNSKSSIYDVAKASFGKFFKERGRNLLVAAITFIGLWWVLLRAYGILNQQSFFSNRLNPQLRRLIRTISNLLIVFVCVLASLISLYLLDDWLLLSIAILFLMALAWTSRQLIPNVMKELRIIMNLGTVREGERIIWKGVPFLVKEIGLYTTLVNEQLAGGIIRMPVGELIGQHSRPVVDFEPWFPTHKGDWVVLDDEAYGRVESQTMEQVTLYNYASLKYYPTSDFLSQKPRNLSKGYRLVIKFGLDYGVQSRICDEIPKMFQVGLKNYLTYYYGKEPSVIESLHVNFESAGSSSLNLIVLVKVNGLYGEDYHPLKWDVNKYLVKICNDNNLVIPFSQVTVSLSDDVKNFASQQTIPNPKPSDQKQV